MLIIGGVLVAAALVVVWRFRNWQAVLVAVVLAAGGVGVASTWHGHTDEDVEFHNSSLCIGVGITLRQAGTHAAFPSPQQDRREYIIGFMAASVGTFRRSAEHCVTSPKVCTAILQHAEDLYGNGRVEDVEWAFKYVADIVTRRGTCTAIPPTPPPELR